MKKTICILFLALFAAQLRAQRDETLFNRSHRGGFFVAPIIEYSNLDKEWNTSVGGGFAFVAGDLFFGGYGLGMVEFDQLLDDDFRRLDMGHGGFWVGYVFPQHKALHLFTSVKAGWGAVNIEFDDDDDDFDYDDAFFALTPEAGLEVNIFGFLRVAGTVGYRFMNGLDDAPNFDKKELETMTGALTIRIGGFGHRRHRWDD
jgi:hypothetical protein